MRTCSMLAVALAGLCILAAAAGAQSRNRFQAQRLDGTTLSVYVASGDSLLAAYSELDTAHVDLLYVPDYLRHQDDADTYMGFDAADAFGLWVGGEQMIDITEDGSQDIIELGDGGDIDIDLNDALFVQGSDGFNVGVRTGDPLKNLHVQPQDGNGILVGKSDAVGDSVGLWFAIDNDGAITPKAGMMFSRQETSGRGTLHIINNNDDDDTEANIVDAAISITSDKKVGIGTTSPGEALHVSGEVAGAAFNAIEITNTSDDAGDLVRLLGSLGYDASGSLRNAGVIFFGKEQDWTSTNSTQDGYVAINVVENAAANERLRLASDGQLFTGGETANTDAGVGSITIQQGAEDDEALALKSSDVNAGGSISGHEADTYGWLEKQMGTGGGVTLGGKTDSDANPYTPVVRIGAYADDVFTNSIVGTGARGIIELDVSMHDGAGNLANVTDGVNLVNIQARRGGSEETVWLVNENGDTSQEGNSEVQGMFSVGDSPAWANDIDVSSGTTFSRMDAGDNQFTVSSRTELKDIQDTLDTALAQEVLTMLRDSVQVQRWTFKPEALRSSKTVQSIWSDTARVAERVQEHVERREKGVVDSTQTVEARQETLRVVTGDTLQDAFQDSIVTRHDTTWAPVYYEVSAEERTGLQDSLLAESLDRVQSQLAAYEAEVQTQAQKQHVGMVAEDAVRLSRLVAPEAAEPGVVNGNHVQAALVLAVQELYRQNRALQDRMDAMQASFDDRLARLEAQSVK